jgi:hypothetical protein
MSMGRDGILAAFLAAFGRAIAEVGAIIIGGGNIRGCTRTMTTTIALAAMAHSRFWHKADVERCPGNVRYWGQSAGQLLGIGLSDRVSAKPH